MTPITKERLLELGFAQKNFFYAVGGGEDEDDRVIYVKDDIALTESSEGGFYKSKTDDLSYQHGFPYNNRINNIEEI